MTFPHYFHLFGYSLHPHPVMELIAYTGGFQLYLYLRGRAARLRPDDPPLPFEQNMWLIVGAIFGALVGSKVLAWLESPMEYFPHFRDPRAWLGGKTIVGGLLGGWVGVELAKKLTGIRRRTGDLYVFPLIFGMAVGRVGCFLTGLDDHTCGSRTSVSWAVDFGDGPRHPAQLYDIAFLAILAVVLCYTSISRRRVPAGAIFRLFMLTYLAYRFLVEFLKDRYHAWLGLSAIQITCLVGTIFCAWSLIRLRTPAPGSIAAPTAA
jgi:phosphatidylglycerol---prolipoprotein diacylglyceryl transferase